MDDDRETLDFCCQARGDYTEAILQRYSHEHTSVRSKPLKDPDTAWYEEKVRRTCVSFCWRKIRRLGIKPRILYCAIGSHMANQRLRSNANNILYLLTSLCASPHAAAMEVAIALISKDFRLGKIEYPSSSLMQQQTPNRASKARQKGRLNGSLLLLEKLPPSFLSLLVGIDTRITSAVPMCLPPSIHGWHIRHITPVGR